MAEGVILIPCYKGCGGKYPLGQNGNVYCPVCAPQKVAARMAPGTGIIDGTCACGVEMDPHRGRCQSCGGNIDKKSLPKEKKE